MGRAKAAKFVTHLEEARRIPGRGRADFTKTGLFSMISGLKWTE